jgi:hypothetical protein
MLDSPAVRSVDRTASGLRLRFIIALALVGALTLLAEVALQWSLARQQHDAHIINIAGQQRTLSQKIAKTGYRIIGLGTAEARRDANDELREALAQFQRVHLALQRGDEGLGLPDGNSVKIGGLFGNVEPDYQAMVNAANTLLSRSDVPTEHLQAVQRLSEHEPPFLLGMDAIVAQYEHEAAGRVAFARWLGLGFGILILATLIVAARQYVEPAMRKLQRDMQQQEQHAAEMTKVFASSPTALFVVDAASLAIVRANLKAELLMGSAIDNFIGQPFSAYFDTRLEANKAFLQRIRAGEIFDEHQVLLIDARNNAVHALASSRQFASSGQRGYLVAITDIGGLRKT